LRRAATDTAAAGSTVLLEGVRATTASSQGGGVSERLLTAAEIAEMLSVPVSWVRESTRSGAIPCVQLGRYRRYVLEDVLAWLDECKRPGRPVALRRVDPRR
jgi:excisionase family DNA binding protein